MPYLDCPTALAAPLNGTVAPDDLQFKSAFYAVRLSSEQPAFAEFTLDSIGKRKLNDNLAIPARQYDRKYTLARDGDTVSYISVGAVDRPALWSFRFSEKSFSVTSRDALAGSPSPLVFSFSIESHTTLLGRIDDDGSIRLPALLHVPNHGTLRVSASHAVNLRYDASRDREKFIEVIFPDAAPHETLEYTFEIVSVFPPLGSPLDSDARFDGYRRDFLSMFQLNPRRRALANNVASDTCAFTVFEYAMMAAPLPALAEGLTAMSMVRDTLDRYIGGMKAYGMKGYRQIAEIRYDFLDDYPSLVLAAAECQRVEPDHEWVARNYSVLRSWTEKMIAFDADGDGLMEYPLSGNAGSWPKKISVRPANWWDTIGFGHKDAYSNALAYPAFLGMERMAREAGHADDARRYQQRAEMLKNHFYSTFYHPSTGVLAGWKSSDGQLHDYYFLFINGMAVTYGLVTDEEGNAIWDRLLEKMEEVGYHRFDLGLPGNLIPIRQEDYADDRLRFGGPQLPDGSDGFQIYENGGATACYAYYTIRALFKLGRTKEAQAILYPMLQTFSEGGFQGRAPNGMTYDWMTWSGNAHGYEGLLVDGYLTLLATVPNA